jgi:aryl-alcohol dehydrogenase-like predicted oxidoreductase
MLTGKYQRHAPLPGGSRFAAWKALGDRYANDANFDLVERLERFAEQRGHSLLELAFSWLAANPAVSSVIAGATRPEQVEQNAKAPDWAPTPDELAEIDRPTKQAAHA